VLSLGTAFRHREGSSVQLSREGAPAATAIRSSSVNPDMQLGLRNGMSLAFGLTTLSQRNASNGNETDLDQNDVTSSFGYSFRLPRSISRGRKSIRSSLSFLSSGSRTCLQQRQAEACVVVSDVAHQEVRGGLDTDLLQELSGGLQFGYSINDARHLNRRTSQISIIASFQLSLFAGDYR
jgi:hypothetical protein